MNFKRASKRTKIGGTCYQGEVDVSYQKLVETFGRPMGDDGCKVDAEWVVESDCGTVLTIYNYKDGKNYLGEEGIPTEELRDWHIGGYSKSALEMIQLSLFYSLFRAGSSDCTRILERGVRSEVFGTFWGGEDSW